jgi:hypothetical protein
MIQISDLCFIRRDLNRLNYLDYYYFVLSVISDQGYFNFCYNFFFLF